MFKPAGQFCPQNSLPDGSYTKLTACSWRVRRFLVGGAEQPDPNPSQRTAEGARTFESEQWMARNGLAPGAAPKIPDSAPGTKRSWQRWSRIRIETDRRHDACSPRDPRAILPAGTDPQSIAIRSRDLRFPLTPPSTDRCRRRRKLLSSRFPSSTPPDRRARWRWRWRWCSPRPDPPPPPLAAPRRRPAAPSWWRAGPDSWRASSSTAAAPGGSATSRLRRLAAARRAPRRRRSTRPRPRRGPRSTRP